MTLYGGIKRSGKPPAGIFRRFRGARLSAARPDGSETGSIDKRKIRKTKGSQELPEGRKTGIFF